MRAAILLLLVVSEARADTPQELVARWLAAQNRGDFAAYQALYAPGFSGRRVSGGRTVILDRAGWLEDRQRMFARPMVVKADKIVAAGKIVDLEQTWESGDYKDVGPKRLELVEFDGRLLIAKEELLASRRLLLPGQVMQLFAPAKNADAVLARLTHAADAVGVVTLDAELTARGVLVGQCDGDAVNEIADAIQALEPTVTARVIRGKPKSCPTLPVAEAGDDKQWSWPATASAVVPGGRSVSVLVFAYRADDMGDFGRSHRGHEIFAFYRGSDGELLDELTASSPSDFTELESVTPDGKRVLVEETYIDEPCDGTNGHRYKRLRRELTVDPDPRQPDKLRRRERKETLERGRCDDAEYKRWMEQMNR